MTGDKIKISVSMLSPAVDPAQLGFDDTSELEPLNEIIGLERAKRRTRTPSDIGSP